MTMHSLSSSPSNIVSIARFLERVGDVDRLVSVEEECRRSSCTAVSSGVIAEGNTDDDFGGGGEGFPSV